RDVREAARQAPSTASEPPPARRRLTFKDKHALETLPKTIAGLQEDMRKLQTKLDDFMPAIVPGLRKLPPRSANSGSGLPRRRNSGLSWKSCARNWPAADRDDFVRIRLVMRGAIATRQSRRALINASGCEVRFLGLNRHPETTLNRPKMSHKRRRS